MNGKDERKNRTYTELIVVTLLNFGTASFWWGEILLIVCYALKKKLNFVPIRDFEKLKKQCFLLVCFGLSWLCAYS